MQEESKRSESNEKDPQKDNHNSNTWKRNRSSNLSIALRTRSKCSLSTLNVFDLENNLPDELLSSNTNANEDDNVWHEFLKGLAQESNGLFDEDNDPDFNFNDNDIELDIDADQIVVPQREAEKLVQETILIVGPLIYEKTPDLTKRRSNECRQKSNDILTNNLIETEPSDLVATTESFNQRVQDIHQEEVIIENVTQEMNIQTQYLASDVFVPSFTNDQRKQLDEQLRNHVQLLTQSALYCCFNKDDPFKEVFEDAYGLLNILNNMKNNLASNFEILNLNESLKILNENKQYLSMKPEEKTSSITNKYCDIIVSSPVFYNIDLLPTTRYRYSSQYTKAQFSEPEQKLLMIGNEKFGHLPKTECNELIHAHLLPIRSPNEICKKLIDLKKCHERREKINRKMNEPIKRTGLDFVKERDYKSPLEKADKCDLPSIYTMSIERLKLAKLLVVSKEIPKEPVEKPAKQSHQRLKQALENTKPLSTQENNNKKRRRESNDSVRTPKTPKNRVVIAQMPISPAISNSTIEIVNDSSKKVLNTSNINQLIPTIAIPQVATATNTTNGAGIIFMQPTIHVHVNTPSKDTNKYRKIVPKTSQSSSK